MQTLGYRFKPWTGSKALADGPSILSYVRETAAESGIDAHIRYGHKVVRAEWSTAGRPLDGPRRGSRAAQLPVPADVQRLLPLRRGLHAAVRGPRGLRRRDRAPAVLAARPRFRRQAHRRHRQRRNRGHARPGARALRRRARDDAPALALLHPLDARRGRDRQRAATAARRAAGVRDRALEEHRPPDPALPAQPALPAPDAQALPRRRPAPAARRLRGRHALQPALQAVGPAAVPRPQRRPLRDASPTGARRSSPPRSSASPSAASACATAPSSRPT